jgi:hypothetical protein
VTRKVSRLEGFCSAEVEASSAIMGPFYIYSGKCSMVKLVMETFFLNGKTLRGRHSLFMKKRSSRSV